MKDAGIGFRSIFVQPAWLLLSLRAGFHKDTTTGTTLRSYGAARPAGQQKEAELRFDLLLSGKSVSIVPSPLLCYTFDFCLRDLQNHYQRGFGVRE